MIDIEQLSLEYRREKLRALVKFGTFSGRVKDIFDLCYLSEYVDTYLSKYASTEQEQEGHETWQHG